MISSSLKHFLLCLTGLCFCQQLEGGNLDSLENKLKTANGIEKVDVLNELYKEYRNNDPTKALGLNARGAGACQEFELPKRRRRIT